MILTCFLIASDRFEEAVNEAGVGDDEQRLVWCHRLPAILLHLRLEGFGTDDELLERLDLPVARHDVQEVVFESFVSDQVEICLFFALRWRSMTLSGNLEDFGSYLGIRNHLVEPPALVFEVFQEASVNSDPILGCHGLTVAFEGLSMEQKCVF